MVQVPAATSVTVVPDTIQTAGEAELNATVNPEVAVAEIVKGGTPMICVATGVTVIDCGPPLTLNDCVIAAAAL